MRKFLIALIVIFLIAIAGAAGLWHWLNYSFIPDRLVPEVNRQLADFNRTSEIKVEIKNIFYHQYKGFQLTGIKIAVADRGVLLSAREADIDLDYLAFFKRQVVVSRLTILGAELDVSRDRRGKWNFSPLVELGPFKGELGGASFFRLERIELKEGVISFSDDLQKRNSLKRRYSHINLEVSNPGEEYYVVNLSGGSPDPKKERLELSLTYDHARQSLAARGRFATRYLKEYWGYYFDDIFKPWHLSAEEVEAEIEAAYLKNVWALNNRYLVKGAKLTHGDTVILGDVEAGHRQKGVSLEAMIDIGRGGVKFGEKILFEKADAALALSNNEIVIKRVHGWARGRPLFLSGHYRFGHPGALYLTGKYADTFHTLGAKIYSDNRGLAELSSRAGASRLDLRADIHDLKNLAIGLTVNGELAFPASGEVIDLSIELGSFEAEGRVNFRGRLAGELDKIDSLDGNLLVRARYQSYPDNKKRDFSVYMKAEDGSFAGKLPTLDFFGGTLEGVVKFDSKRWGTEVHYQGFELTRFAQFEPLMAGTKGRFDGNLTLVAEWSDWRTVRGGGYFDVTDCSLKNAPIFADAAQGIASITKGVEFPDFKKLVGNFEVSNEAVSFSQVFAHALSMDLSLSGLVTFAGEADVTAGIKLNAGFYTRLRQVLIPFTIGFDLARGAIRVKVTGQWPNFDQQTRIEQINWLEQFYGTTTTADPDKYSLGEEEL